MLSRRKQTRLSTVEMTILSVACRHSMRALDSLPKPLSQTHSCEVDPSVPRAWLCRDGLCMYETGVLTFQLATRRLFTRNIPHYLNHVPIYGLEDFRLRKTMFFENVNVASITVDKAILQTEDFDPTFKP